MEQELTQRVEFGIGADIYGPEWDQFQRSRHLMALNRIFEESGQAAVHVTFDLRVAGSFKLDLPNDRVMRRWLHRSADGSLNVVVTLSVPLDHVRLEPEEAFRERFASLLARGATSLDAYLQTKGLLARTAIRAQLEPYLQTYRALSLPLEAVTSEQEGLESVLEWWQQGWLDFERQYPEPTEQLRRKHERSMRQELRRLGESGQGEA